NRLANFLERVFSTFKDDPYSHYQVRGKDNRKKVGITLRLFRKILDKERTEKRIKEFMRSEGVPDDDFEIDPLKNEEGRFKDWSGFIQPDIQVHRPFQKSYVTTLHDLSVFCVSLLNRLERGPHYSKQKVDMIHEFVWMMGAVEIAVPMDDNEKVCPGYNDRVTGQGYVVGGKCHAIANK
ncbi:MAG: hypothetical protein ACXADD_15560, partial [Candidatus Thorarchaeota archaeon]